MGIIQRRYISTNKQISLQTEFRNRLAIKDIAFGSNKKYKNMRALEEYLNDDVLI